MTHHATAKRWLRMFLDGMSMMDIALTEYQYELPDVENAIRDELNRRDKKR